MKSHEKTCDHLTSKNNVVHVVLQKIQVYVFSQEFIPKYVTFNLIRLAFAQSNELFQDRSSIDLPSQGSSIRK
jgi:hypothetical protein